MTKTGLVYDEIYLKHWKSPWRATFRDSWRGKYPPISKINNQSNTSPIFPSFKRLNLYTSFLLNIDKFVKSEI